MAVTVRQLMDHSADYAHEAVSLTGTIVVECPEGCWFFLDDGTGKLYIDLKPAGLTIPQRIGSRVTVSGKVAGSGGSLQLQGEDVRFLDEKWMLELSLVFLTGVLASLHCISMCGGFVAAYSLRLGGKGRRGMHPSILWSHLLYNGGRLATYTLIGGLMGLIGSFIAASGELMGIQGLASIAAGCFMILMGLSLGRWIPYTALLQPAWASQFSRLSCVGEGLASRTMSLGTLPLGSLLGLMPCGPLYAMEIDAAGTGSIGMGMLTLLTFGLGTLPTLFAFGLASTLVGHRLPRRLFQVATFAVIVLGMLTLLRGLAMNGWIPHAGIW